MNASSKKTVKHYGKNGFKYKPKFGLILICEDEKTQEELFNNLSKQGLKPKVVQV